MCLHDCPYLKYHEHCSASSMLTETRSPETVIIIISESESELFTGDTSKNNHSPGHMIREVSP